jgi:hypothetical protein
MTRKRRSDVTFTKAPQRPKREREDTFANHVARPRKPARGSGELATALAGIAALELAPIKVSPKTPERKSQAIRESANGEQCLVRLPGCDGGATTVWCHLPEAVAGRGMGLKGIDILGAYGCRNCHDIADRRAPRPEGMTEHDVALMFYRALARSVVRLAQKGLV